MLRPATFEALGQRLRSAQAGRPALPRGPLRRSCQPCRSRRPLRGLGGEPRRRALRAAAGGGDGPRARSLLAEEIYPREPPEGAQSYLLFESPDSGENPRLVEGAELGGLLVETEVPMLVLGACRSAHVEAPTRRTQAEASAAQRQARAWGGLAQEVMNAGVAGVLAMRFNVYVVTAAQFVADLYGALTCGCTLGEAVTLGRRQLESRAAALGGPRSASAAGLARAGGLRGGAGPALRGGAGGACAGAPHRGRRRCGGAAGAGRGVAADSRGGLLRPRRDAAGARSRASAAARSCCYTPTRAAARRRPRPSSRAGTRSPEACRGRCSS